MRKVSVRQLQINPTQEFKDLPFRVTRYKKVLGVVMSASELRRIKRRKVTSTNKTNKTNKVKKKKKVLTSINETKTETKPETKPERRPAIGALPLCKHGFPPEMCKFFECRS